MFYLFLCIFIIADTWLFVKTFFFIFFELFWLPWLSTLCPFLYLYYIRYCLVCQALFLKVFLEFQSHLLSPFDSCIIAPFQLSVKSFFNFFFDFLSVDFLSYLPLTLIIIADYTENAIYKMHKDNIKTLCSLILDTGPLVDLHNFGIC